MKPNVATERYIMNAVAAHKKYCQKHCVDECLCSLSDWETSVLMGESNFFSRQRIAANAVHDVHTIRCRSASCHASHSYHSELRTRRDLTSTDCCLVVCEEDCPRDQIRERAEDLKRHENVHEGFAPTRGVGVDHDCSDVEEYVALDAKAKHVQVV